MFISEVQNKFALQRTLISQRAITDSARLRLFTISSSAFNPLSLNKIQNRCRDYLSQQRSNKIWVNYFDWTGTFLNRPQATKEARINKMIVGANGSLFET